MQLPDVIPKQSCYDLAKWLSYYLYFFSYLDLLYKKGVQEKGYMTNVIYHSYMLGCHSVISHDRVT